MNAFVDTYSARLLQLLVEAPAVRSSDSTLGLRFCAFDPLTLLVCLGSCDRRL